MPKLASPRLQTETRLLEAAGELFAQKGYRDATIRDICARARANVAAVNYHFGGKQGLYAAVVRYARRCSPFARASDGDGLTPQQQLQQFVSNFLQRIFDAGRPAWYARLMAREMVEPTRVFDQIVREQIAPHHARLRRIIREIVGGDVSEEAVRDCALSVVGQCIFYGKCRAVIQRLYPESKFGPKEIERLARHITAFSLGALKQFKRAARSPAS
jgi:AcrR family transcriptional regulator